MSAVARNYVYEVKITERKPEPTISLETLKQYQADVAKYLRKPESDRGNEKR